MGDTAKIGEAKMREALAAVAVAQDTALREWKVFTAIAPRRMNAVQRENEAFLRGRLDGLHQAHSEFERRSPVEFQEQ